MSLHEPKDYFAKTLHNVRKRAVNPMVPNLF